MFHANPSSLTPRQIAAAHWRGRSGLVSAWLWSVAALVFLMVVVGGATRLTESGLSITEWKPIAGVVPPLGHAAWLDAFAKYKQIPQYASLFPDMTLGHFQAIFLMEWTHRLIGRLLGIALFVPLVVFWARGMLEAALKWRMAGIVALVGLQGFVGWWMVSSGLTHRVEVAQERLATHLLLASLTFAALVWLAAGRKRTLPNGGADKGSSQDPGIERVPRALHHLASLAVVLVLVQIGLGGLVAGLRAGQAYNTWPLMDGSLIPPADVLGAMTPLWRNLVDNLTTVQFQHRMTAYLLLAVVVAQAIWLARVAPGTSAKRRSVALAGLVAGQATIGILTLILAVPIWAGLLHQAFAMVVLAMAVVHRQRLAAIGMARGMTAGPTAEGARALQPARA